MAEPVRNVPKAAPRKKAAARPSGRNRILALGAGMLVGVFILLSIVSYGGANDEMILDDLSFLDAFRLPFDDGVRSMVSGLENRLGLFGAFTAHFFVDLTVGWFSAVFPLLLILWCAVVMAGRGREKPVLVTNYTLLYALLIPATFGTLHYSIDSVGKAWYGLVGAFIAEILVGLLGSVGGLIFLFAALAAATVYLFNVDLGDVVENITVLSRELMSRWKARSSARPAAAVGPGVPGNGRPQGTTLIRAMEEEPVPADDGAIDEPDDQEAEEDVVPVEYPGDEPGIPGGDDGERPVSIEIQRVAPEDDDGPPRPPKAARSEASKDEEIDYVFPSVELLDQPRQSDTVDRDELEANAGLVRSKLAHFGVEIESVSVTPGPVITLYELVPASGVKISRIVSLADDLALALAAKGIRIMAPIPGKSAVGVEIPNRNPSMVSLRSIVNSQKFRESKGYLPIALGKGISGDVIVDDLSRMPHLLIAGATGSGKSVGINTLMTSLLYRLHPSEVKFVIIDPKKIELTQYAKLKYHYLAMSPDLQKEIITTPEDAVGILRSVELEMERRYDQLAAAGVRNLQDYNERYAAGRLKNTEKVTHHKIPYLVVIIDELADLMLTAAREVEEPIARLAQLARAVGIHLVLATQRPSVDVITGVIKANFPARIAFQVSSKIDSRTILDMNGADQLLGAGDMLYLPAGSPKPSRIQNAYISTEEIERVTEHISRQDGFSQPYMLPSILERKRAGAKGGGGQQDEFFEEAARLIVRHQQGSVSLLQRRLKVGYSRAARLVDELEAAGIVGPYDGSKAREVLIESDEQLDALLRNQGI
jgi:S-DNA-T family DNA segregation ATPase FtsK/SpoIIIE